MEIPAQGVNIKLYWIGVCLCVLGRTSQLYIAGCAVECTHLS